MCSVGWSWCELEDLEPALGGEGRVRRGAAPKRVSWRQECREATHRSVQPQHADHAASLLALPTQLALQLNDDELAADLRERPAGGGLGKVVRVEGEVDAHAWEGTLGMHYAVEGSVR